MEIHKEDLLAFAGRRIVLGVEESKRLMRELGMGAEKSVKIEGGIVWAEPTLMPKQEAGSEGPITSLTPGYAWSVVIVVN